MSGRGDTISREMAIGVVGRRCGMCIQGILDIPSAQPKIEERKGKSAQNVPKEDLISRKAAIDAIMGLPTWWADEGGYYGGAQPPMEALLDPKDAISAIENLPSAEPERKTARWIHKGGGSFICSDCGEMVGLNTYRSERAGEIFLYCPHCGAYMGATGGESDV